MGAPGDVPAFDADLALQAAEHFKARKKQRDAKEKAVDNGEYSKAKTTKRMADRANRLLASVEGAVAKTSTPSGRRAVRARARLAGQAARTDPAWPGTRPKRSPTTSWNASIGVTRDFLAIDFFAKGTVASRAVCRIVTKLSGGRRGLGTGFMVTRSLLITNHHVLDIGGHRQT